MDDRFMGYDTDGTPWYEGPDGYWCDDYTSPGYSDTRPVIAWR